MFVFQFIADLFWLRRSAMDRGGGDIEKTSSVVVVSPKKELSRNGSQKLAFRNLIRKQH